MEANNLYETIKNDPNLKRYQELEKLFNSNKAIQTQMYRLKQLQKQLVNAKHIEKHKLTDKLESEYQMLLQNLYEIPLMEEYLELQAYFNEVMKSITDVLENEINAGFNEGNT